MGKRKLESDLDDELDGDGRTHKAPGGYNSDEEIPSEVKVIGKIMEKKESMNGKADKGRALYQAFEVDDNLYEVVRNFRLLPGSLSVDRGCCSTLHCTMSMLGLVAAIVHNH